MSSDPEIDVFWLKSRVMRALYYQRRTRKMVVQTAHGKLLIYTDIDQDLTTALAAHAAPGMLYEQKLRAALRPKLATMTFANFLLLRRIRKLGRTILQAAPDDHTDRCPDAGR
jgi:hypothetical protein